MLIILFIKTLLVIIVKHNSYDFNPGGHCDTKIVWFNTATSNVPACTGQVRFVTAINYSFVFLKWDERGVAVKIADFTNIEFVRHSAGFWGTIS